MDVCGYEDLRLILGSLSTTLFNIGVIYYFSLQGIYLFLWCIFIMFQITFLIQFIRQAPQGTFTIDLRSQYEKRIQEEERVLGLVEGKKKQILFEAIEGHISKKEAEEKLELLDDFFDMNIKYLE